MYNLIFISPSHFIAYFLWHLCSYLWRLDISDQQSYSSDMTLPAPVYHDWPMKAPNIDCNFDVAFSNFLGNLIYPSLLPFFFSSVSPLIQSHVAWVADSVTLCFCLFIKFDSLLYFHLYCQMSDFKESL